MHWNVKYYLFLLERSGWCFHFCWGVQIRGGWSISACGFGPGSGFGPGLQI